MPKRVDNPPMNLLEQSYVPEILRGLGKTVGHFFRGLSGTNYHNEMDAWFLEKGNVTLQYPEEKQPYAPRYRAQHRLMLREDGHVRCVACMCCSTICPANCIHITAAEHDDPSIEKYPEQFVIDELRCIHCGFCVEACPCDAIRMDTGEHVRVFTERDEAYFDRNELASRGALSAAVQGGDPMWREEEADGEGERSSPERAQS
ncbi:MAG: NADH-quinone oxidoreductase subunit I [Myxococcota bacterium]|jgi:NADH-quinone oxidoreductase subunit I|nr:NADH-quinone oxidoreductase subunit I [Myxococcota bacterium]